MCVKHFIYYYYYYYYISNSYLNWACACRGRVERRKRRDIRWCKPFTPAEVHPITNQLRLNKATCAACDDWIRYCGELSLTMYCTLIHTIAGKVPLVLCSVRHKVPLPTHHSLSRPSVGSQPGASKTWRREYPVWEQWTPPVSLGVRKTRGQQPIGISLSSWVYQNRRCGWGRNRLSVPQAALMMDFRLDYKHHNLVLFITMFLLTTSSCTDSVAVCRNPRE